MFMLLGGYPPFHGATKDELTKNISSNNYAMINRKWRNVSESAKHFVQSLLVTDASKRLTAGQALDHPWIATYMGAGDEKRDDTILTSDVVLSLGQYVASSRFRRACMQMMVWSLSSEDLREVQDIFLSLDKSKKGTIRLVDLKSELATKFATQEGTSPLAMTPLASLDSNHDESIHFSDFLAAMVQNRINPRTPMIRDTFNRFDTEHSGVITAENLSQVLGEHFEGENVAVMIREAGGLEAGKVTYEEFCSYIKEPSVQVPSGWFRKLSRRVTETELGKTKPDACRNVQFLCCCPIFDWLSTANWSFSRSSCEIMLERPKFTKVQSINTNLDS